MICGWRLICSSSSGPWILTCLHILLNKIIYISDTSQGRQQTHILSVFVQRTIYKHLGGLNFTRFLFLSPCPLPCPGFILRVLIRMRCWPPPFQRSRGPTWQTLSCCWSHWAFRICFSSTSWIHRRRTTCSTPCTSSGSWGLWTTQVGGEQAYDVIMIQLQCVTDYFGH